MPRQARVIWEIQQIPVQVTRRRMKHLRIYVYPPDGEVRVSAPWYVSNAEVQEFIHERLDWVKDQRAYFQAQPRKAETHLQNGDRIFVLGEACELQVKELTRGHNKMWREGEKLFLQIKADADIAARQKALQNFQRKLLKERIPLWIEHWQPRLGVVAREWGIKKMRTRWGSCNINKARIWLNLDLARYPENCLQYVVLHELAHLLEANHSPRFWGLVEAHMPEWKSIADTLHASRFQ